MFTFVFLWEINANPDLSGNHSQYKYVRSKYIIRTDTSIAWKGEINLNVHRKHSAVVFSDAKTHELLNGI